MPVITRSQSKKLEDVANKTQPIAEKPYQHVKTMEPPLPAKQLQPNPRQLGWILINGSPVQIVIPGDAKTNLNRQVQCRDLAEYQTNKYDIISSDIKVGPLVNSRVFYLTVEAALSQLVKSKSGLSETIDGYSIYNPRLDNGEYKMADVDGAILKIVSYKNGILRGYHDFQSVPNEKITFNYVPYKHLLCYKVRRNAETGYIIHITTENMGLMSQLEPEFKKRILEENADYPKPAPV